MSLAVLAVREQPCDWTLPPQTDVVWIGAGHRPLGVQFASTPEATEWVTARLAAGDRVIATGIDLLLAWWLYRRPGAPTIPTLTEALMEGRLVSLDDVDAAIATVMRTTPTEVGTTVHDLLLHSRSVNAWIEENTASAFWSRQANELMRWLTRQAPTPSNPVQPDTAGTLGTAPSVLNRSVGLVMSWYGLAVDDDRVAELLASGDKATADRVADLHTSVREDNRCHPWHYLQVYKRLGSQWPNYQTLSWRRSPDERSAITVSRGYNLQGLDVAQAELHTTAACWSQLFDDSRLTNLLAAGADIHTGTGRRLVDENLVPRQIPPQRLRQLGKAINLAFMNLASSHEIATIINDFSGHLPHVQDISRLLTTIGREYPAREWTSLCARIAAHSSTDSSALVPTLTGRWLRVQATRNNKPPAVAVASAMTQSIFADMHAMGMVELIRAMGRSLTANGRLVASVFDELLVEMPKVGVIDDRPYIAGTQRILRTPGMRADVRQFGSHWSG